MTLEEKIRNLFEEVVVSTGGSRSGPIGRDTVLLQSGLDSLGFAILVARLEEELGYDPFLLMSEPVYPRTFGEFLDLYERFRPNGPNVDGGA